MADLLDPAAERSASKAVTAFQRNTLLTAKHPVVPLADASGLAFDDADTAPGGNGSDTAPTLGDGSYPSTGFMALNLFWLLIGRCTSCKSSVNFTPPGFQPGDGSASSNPGSSTPSEAGLSIRNRSEACEFTLASAATAAIFLALVTLSLFVSLSGRHISADSTTSPTPPGYIPGDNGASPRTLGVIPEAAAMPALETNASHLLAAFVSFLTGTMPSASCVARLTAIFFALAAFFHAAAAAGHAASTSAIHPAVVP